MPLPLILGGIAVGTAALGIGKGIKAGADMKDAGDTNEYAKKIIKESKKDLNIRRKTCGIALSNLGSKKYEVLNNTMNRFISSFEKLKNIEFTDSAGLNELDNFHIDKQSVKKLKELDSYATSIVGGTVTGALGGALTAFGAYSAAMTFASASTGTAIATLSGAAATNATLAFFGGGSLAAGGLGIAGGTTVLGGLVAGPALAVMGFVIGAKASSQKDNSYSNLAEARKICEELKTAGVACNAIRRRAYMFYRLLIRLNILFLPLIINMENAINTKGENFKNFSEDEKHAVAGALSIASSIKAILDTPILTESGFLTEESEKIGEAISKRIA